MSDLIDKQVVLDTIHLFFTEEIDKIPTKKTEDGEVYVIHKCQPLFEMNKAICKRIKALPSVTPTHNCVGNALDMRCGDAISRQAVLDLLFNSYIKTELTSIGNASKEYAELCVDELNELPSVNPQPICEDAISRQKVLDVINLNWDYRRNCIRAIEKLPPVNPQEPKWIPVSERLPEHYQNILFSTKTDRVFEGKYFKDETEHQWYSFRDECFAWNNVVTAWMPLPKPYKAESEVNTWFHILPKE